jgi:hypothetical protein
MISYVWRREHSDSAIRWSDEALDGICYFADCLKPAQHTAFYFLSAQEFTYFYYCLQHYEWHKGQFREIYRLEPLERKDD